MIEKAFIHGAYYNMETIGDIICKAGPCQMRLLLPQVDIKHVDGWMTQKNAVKFLDWYAESTPRYEYVINNLSKAIRADQKKSRAVARKYRWHIAHRQEYKCLHCKLLLHPDAFDIDHIEELRSGSGQLQNLSTCFKFHAKSQIISFRGVIKVDLDNLQQPC